MPKKPTYEELVQRVKELEKETSESKLKENLVKIQRDLSAALNTVENLNDGLGLCLEAALAASGMDCGGVYLLDEASGALDVVYHYGLPSDFTKESSHYDSDSDNAKLVLAGRPIYTQQQNLDVSLSEVERQENLCAIAVLPISHHNRVIGCLNVASHSFAEVPFISRNALEAIVSQISGAIIRLQTEKALRESEEKYRLLVENANDSIFITQDDVIEFANPKTEEMTGYSVEELRKIPFANLIHPDDRNMVFEEHARRLAEEELPGTHTYRTINRTGEESWNQINAVPITWEGKPAALNFVRDITQQKELEDQLGTAQRIEALGALAGGIAHDFNNLLMGILGNTSLILVDKDSGSPDYDKLKSIDQYVQDGADLTKQLLGFARGGRYEVKPEDLNELIKNHNRMFGRTKKEISIQGKYEKDLWAVEVDHGQIEQVLLNLYINAWQAMPGGGNLYVHTENTTLDEYYVKPFAVEPGSYVKISINDTGVGMDEATRQRIFEPFFTTKERGRGTGLGLASVYGIIKNHAGFINVYSEKGEGTTFNIYLPASETTDIEQSAKNKKEGKIPHGTETILLVDDEEMIIDVSAQMLEKLGYNALLARSGQEAIDIYKGNRDKIDIVILDMIMPETSGGETYDRFKKTDSDIKVLLSSGYSIDGKAQEILNRGCNGFIQKPFSMKELSQKLREILDKK